MIKSRYVNFAGLTDEQAQNLFMLRNFDVTCSTAGLKLGPPAGLGWGAGRVQMSLLKKYLSPVGSSVQMKLENVNLVNLAATDYVFAGFMLWYADGAETIGIYFGDDAGTDRVAVDHSYVAIGCVGTHQWVADVSVVGATAIAAGDKYVLELVCYPPPELTTSVQTMKQVLTVYRNGALLDSIEVGQSGCVPQFAIPAFGVYSSNAGATVYMTVSRMAFDVDNDLWRQ